MVSLLFFLRSGLARLARDRFTGPVRCLSGSPSWIPGGRSAERSGKGAGCDSEPRLPVPRTPDHSTRVGHIHAATVGAKAGGGALRRASASSPANTATFSLDCLAARGFAREDRNRVIPGTAVARPCPASWPPPSGRAGARWPGAPARGQPRRAEGEGEEPHQRGAGRAEGIGARRGLLGAERTDQKYGIEIDVGVEQGDRQCRQKHRLARAWPGFRGVAEASGRNARSSA